MNDEITESEKIMLFRYELVRPLIELNKKDCRSRIKQLSKKSHLFLNNKIKISERTFRRWLRRYRIFGVQGLKPKERNDKGKTRSIEEKILSKIIKLKIEKPSRSVRKVIRLMELDPMINIAEGNLKLSTISRILKAKRLTTKLLATNEGKKVYGRFEASRPNKLWTSDVGSGIYLPDKRKKSGYRQTFFIVISDDHSRLMCGLKFYFYQDVLALEDILFLAILKYGIPSKLYVDNGKIYVSDQLKLICAELGIKLIHCKKYYAPGRGKVESNVKFVKRDFVSEASNAGIETLEELNSHAEAWREVEFNNRIHSETKEKAIERWSKIKKIRTKTKEELEIIFLFRSHRKVDNKTCIVRAFSNKYEAPKEYIGQWINIRYNPFNLSRIYLSDKNKLIELKPYEIKQHVDKKAVKETLIKTNKFEVKESSVNFLKALQGKAGKYSSESLIDKFKSDEYKKPEEIKYKKLYTKKERKK